MTAPRSVLITGCSSGIGRDAALFLHARGWHVFAACRRPEDCSALRDLGLDSPRMDLDDPASIETGLAEVLDATGGTLDALCNNAGFALPGAVEDLPREALRRQFETNLFGTHDLTTKVIPVMRRQGHGRIVTISSVLGLVPLRWRGAYVASKHGLEGLTDTLRLEMADSPVRVILIEPGPITSEIRAKSIPGFERWIDWQNSPRRAQYEAALLPRLYTARGPDPFELPPRAVSETLLRALTAPRPKPRYYVTKPTHLMGAARRLLPTRALDWLIARGG